VPADSKSDNFKVGDQKPREIDTRFFDDANGNGHTSADEPWLLGRSIRWTDPLGASNIKWSDLAPELMVNHEPTSRSWRPAPTTSRSPISPAARWATSGSTARC
jgi:hypothetical protein